MNYQLARQNMVDNQIRTNHVTNNNIISAMTVLPRERFVPESLTEIAYVDTAIQVANGRHIVAPMVLARLIQEANVSSDDLVQVIGCGTGYAAAILSNMSKAVVLVEDQPEVCDKAEALFIELGIDNVLVFKTDLVNGCKKQAPFNIIIICGAVEEIPINLVNQLVEGGRIITMILASEGVSYPTTKATILTKYNGKLVEKEVFEVNTPKIKSFNKDKVFKF
ncbi:MAG: protein-L-isoaspartate O-methyltransferase [Rhodospirillales bacterium]|nr:protein-L-isoaspartate O-methyltransferase [Rhodospirillales bacterium]